MWPANLKGIGPSSHSSLVMYFFLWVVISVIDIPYDTKIQTLGRIGLKNIV